MARERSQARWTRWTRIWSPLGGICTDAPHVRRFWSLTATGPFGRLRLARGGRGRIVAEGTVKITDQDFDRQVKEGGLTLVDFWAEWCGPCRVIAPILEDLAREYAGRLTIAKLNVDENRDTPARFGIRSIPTLLIFKGGARVDQVIGSVPKGVLKAKIEQYL